MCIKQNICARLGLAYVAYAGFSSTKTEMTPRLA